MITTIERIEKQSRIIANNEHERIKPGMPVAFSEACTPGDCIRQGDLYLIVVTGVPENYVAVKKPTSADKQLVPGNTQGSRHCLDAIAGAKLYRPAKWDAESLEGPCLVLTKARRVLHPTHGAVTIPAGFTILCRYQREWSKEEAKQLRARD